MGVMVGLWLQPETAAALALDGQVPAEALHVTLCMLEQPATALTEVQLARLLTVVDDLAAWTAPFDGVIGGYGRFYASESSDGQDVAVALVDSPDLMELRDRLCHRLEECGDAFDLKDDHAFCPHITLAYLAPGAAMPVEAIPTLPLRFDALTVAVGDRQTEIRLRGCDNGVMCYADAVVLGEDNRWLQPIERYMEPPEWLPLLPAPGTFEHSSYGTIDLPASRIERFVASVNEGTYQASIPINISHNDEDLELNGALGWFSQARVNADGSADVRVEWTPRGEQAVRDEKFRYVSPEFKASWQDNQKVDHQDVILGLALCTYPFFKDLAIDRAVVASERGAAEPSLSLHYAFSDPVRFVARRTPPASEGPDMSDKTVITAQQFTELKERHDTLSQQFTDLKQRNDELVQKFADSETARATAEAGLAAATTSVQELKDKARRKEFTDEVYGRSEANKIRWVGTDAELAAAVDNLMEFASDKQRDLYIASERGRAQAVTMIASRKPVGSDASPADISSAEARLNAKARAFADAHPGTSFAVAFDKVSQSEKELYAEVQAERKGR